MKALPKSKFALALAIVAGLTAGIAIALLTRERVSAPDFGRDAGAVAAIVGVGDRRPDFMHAGVNGELWRASDFDGRPTLVNFWATWCAPCLREMPVLQSLAKSHAGRLNVVGIAIDDPAAVDAFVDRLGITYPILIGTSDVRETQERFGNPDGMLPYSVVIDAGGIIRWHHLGELDETMLEDALGPLLDSSVP